MGKLKNAINKMRTKKSDRVFADYPCADYLHNALKFISANKTDVAYEEICNALIRSGGTLSEEENAKFRAIKEKHMVKAN